MEKSKTTVRLDMDDVLNELSLHWMDVHEKKTGEKIRSTQWDMHELSEFGEKIYDHFSSEDFYYNVPMKDGADKTIRFLENNSFFFDYLIVSSCKQEDERVFDYVREQKIKWCAEKLHDNAPVKFRLVDNGKHDYPADILVDDNLENLIGHGDQSCLKLLFSATHNAKQNTIQIGKNNNEPLLRVHNHDELQDILTDIMKYQSVEEFISECNDLFYLKI